MKPTFELSETLVDNVARFRDPFFQRFQLRPASKPLQLTDTLSKDYLFPTLYADVTCAIGIFHCNYERAHAMLPHPKLRPVRMTLGRSLVIFSCYEYKNVMNVAPYNEIAMTIPVQLDPKVDIPVLPMLVNVFKGFGYYVLGMPVTSKENQIRGNKIWGLPKVTHEVDISKDGEDCVTVAKDETGERYFELRVPTGGKPTKFDVSANLYSQLDGRLLQSRTNFCGVFNVIKHMNLLAQKGARPDRTYLTIGRGPAAEALRGLEIEEHPFQFRYAQSMNSAFALPNPNFHFEWSGV